MKEKTGQAFDFPEDELVHTTCALDEDCPAETQQMCEYQLVSLTCAMTCYQSKQHSSALIVLHWCADWLGSRCRFGPELMIAPQLHLGATSRQVYLPRLPAGHVWQNWFTNVSLGNGGHTITEQTPLVSGEFPLYQRVTGSTPGPPAPPPSPPAGGYDHIGNGFCLTPGKARVQSWLCDDSGLHPDTCPKTETACAALCTKDAHCTGFM